MKEWPPYVKPFRSNPPDGSVAIALPIKDDLRFFKFTYHSVLAFSDVPFVLTVVDNMSGFKTVQYLESVRRNHQVNLLQYQQEHNVAAEWNLALRFMFSYSTVRYGVCLTPTVVLEPYWLSQLTETMRTLDAGIISPETRKDDPQLLSSCFVFKREVFEDVGGFDESRWQGDFAKDFARRAQEKGHKVVKNHTTYVHKFENNGFDKVLRRAEPAPEREAVL